MFYHDPYSFLIVNVLQTRNDITYNLKVGQSIVNYCKPLTRITLRERHIYFTSVAETIFMNEFAPYTMSDPPRQQFHKAHTCQRVYFTIIKNSVHIMHNRHKKKKLLLFALHRQPVFFDTRLNLFFNFYHKTCCFQSPKLDDCRQIVFFNVYNCASYTPLLTCCVRYHCGPPTC